MKKLFLLLFTILILILILIQGFGVVSAADCNYTGTTIINSSSITNGCELRVASTYTMSGETFMLNGTNANLSVKISVSNVTLNGNGSTLKGNKSTNFGGLLIDGGIFNSVVANITFQDYFWGMRIITASNSTFKNNNFSNNTVHISRRLNGLKNSLIVDNNFINSTSWALGTEASSQTTDNITIFRNNFTLGVYGGIDIYNYTNFNISGNNFSSLELHNVLSSSSCSSVSTATCLNLSISSNWFLGPEYYLSSYMTNLQGNNTFFFNNVISRGYGHSVAFNNAKNVSIYNNTVLNGDDGIKIFTSSNILITGNFIGNMTYDTDTYMRCGWIKHSFNVTISNNVCNESVQGFNMQNVSNITLQNNTFIGIYFSDRPLYAGSDRRTPACAINFLELEKSWEGSGAETYPYTPFQDNKSNLMSSFKSTNVTIVGNTFNNHQCFVSGDGINGITHDLSNYWYVKFNVPSYLKDFTEFWINNNYQNLSWIGGTLTDPTQITTNETMYSTYMSSNRSMASYNINKTRYYFENKNASTSGDPMELIVFNLTNASYLYGNGTYLFVSGPNQTVFSYLYDSENLTIFLLSSNSTVISPQYAQVPTTSILYIDLTDTFNRWLFFFLFAVSVVLFFSPLQLISGMMFLLLGFVMLFNNINFVLSTIVIIVGVIVILGRVRAK